MDLTAGLQPERRARVEARLSTNLMAWLTTVNPAGRPDSVPVWFLVRDDGTILVYSQPGKAKLRNIAANPQVSLGLDVSQLRLPRLAVHEDGAVVAHEKPHRHR